MDYNPEFANKMNSGIVLSIILQSGLDPHITMMQTNTCLGQRQIHIQKLNLRYLSLLKFNRLMRNVLMKSLVKLIRNLILHLTLKGILKQKKKRNKQIQFPKPIKIFLTYGDCLVLDLNKQSRNLVLFTPIAQSQAKEY